MSSRAIRQTSSEQHQDARIGTDVTISDESLRQADPCLLDQLMAAAAGANQLNLSPDREHEGELEYDEEQGTAVIVCSLRQNVCNSGQVVGSEYDEDFEGEGEDQNASYDNETFEMDKDLSMGRPNEASSVSPMQPLEPCLVLTPHAQ